MTIGPDPITRIFWMSVRLGIETPRPKYKRPKQNTLSLLERTGVKGRTKLGSSLPPPAHARDPHVFRARAALAQHRPRLPQGEQIPAREPHAVQVVLSSGV